MRRIKNRPLPHGTRLLRAKLGTLINSGRLPLSFHHVYHSAIMLLILSLVGSARISMMMHGELLIQDSVRTSPRYEFDSNVDQSALA
mmetsp:Transcript_12358/g.26709  ORF Transcript_12358/g.26709 Transcript_12358/m.26709 type:complete len:87 (-) Transcript_12358:7-267(-)